MATKKNPVKKFPSPSTLKTVRETLSDLAYSGGNLALPEDASEIERANYKWNAPRLTRTHCPHASILPTRSSKTICY